MLEKEFHISRLIARHFRGQLTPDEERELNVWLNSSENNRNYFEGLKNEKNIPEELKQYERIKNTTKDEVWRMTLLKLGASFENPNWQSRSKVGSAKIFTSRWIAIAAAIILVVGTIVTLRQVLNPDVENSRDKFVKHDIAAGSNKAYITLSNGKIIQLSGAKTGVIINAAKLQYTDGTAISVEDSKFSTITTPRGGQYQIILSDGTVVYMNAESSIQYPTVFNGANRTIILNGEAYFEVAKDKKHPFIVKSKGQEVQVLGTHFNLNCYNDEPVTKTTLLEGKVVLSQADSTSGLNSKVILQPGEQGILSGTKIQVNKADIENAVAWKNGDFIFNGDDLKSVMRQLARWYNVDVTYQGNLSNIGFVSTISRRKKLSEVLKALEATQGVYFKIEGRRILVMP